MTNPDSVLKGLDIALSTNVCLSQGYGLLSIRYSCESWTIKKAEHPRTDAFEL